MRRTLLQICKRYGVATVSRNDKITGLFCRISSVLYGSFAKETYNFIDPINQSHPIYGCIRMYRGPLEMLDNVGRWHDSCLLLWRLLVCVANGFVPMHLASCQKRECSSLLVRESVCETLCQVCVTLRQRKKERERERACVCV